MSVAMKQLIESGELFNPLSNPETGQGRAYSSSNQTILREAMARHGWEDPRFMTEAQIRKESWRLSEKATGVVVKFVDGDQQRDFTVYNASQVEGIPSLKAMQEKALARLHQFGTELAGIAGPQGHVEHEEPAVVAGALSDWGWDGQKHLASFQEMEEVWPSLDQDDLVLLPMSAHELAAETALEDGRENESSNEHVVGVQDTPSVATGQKPVESRRQMRVEQSRASSEQGKEESPLPASLCGGTFVRDKSGGYCRAGTSKVCLRDAPSALIIRDKREDTYQAAMELAAAKGWTHIALAGKPKMLAEAWFHAQLNGIEVVNYQPTEKDLKRVGDYKAQQVEIRPVEVSKELLATVDDGQELKTVSAAVTALPETSAEKKPAANGTKQEAKPQRVKMEPGAKQVTTTPLPEGVQVAEKGSFTGRVFSITSTHALQMLGRGKVIAHDLAKLSTFPSLDEVATVKYGRDGKGTVALQTKQAGRGHEGR